MNIRHFLRNHRTLLMTFLPPIVLVPLPVWGQSQIDGYLDVTKIYMAGVAEAEDAYSYGITGLILILLYFYKSLHESKCAYGLLLMAYYWTTETFPVAITATLPVILFPMMGISKVSVISTKYFQQITFVSIGGLTVAIAIEKWNVHKRIALRLLLTIGTTPKWLMLGFMLTTWFLSMWISNTATTSMMIPIAQAVISELMSMRTTSDQIKTGMLLGEATSFESASSEVKPNENEYETTRELEPNIHEEMVFNQQHRRIEKQPVLIEIDKLIPVKRKESEDFDFEALDRHSQNLCKAMLLSICYAANCGGVATLTGTSPNLVMKGQVDLISDGQSGITFASWFVFSFPVALINVLLAWVCLQLSFFGIRSLFKSGDQSEGDTVKKIIRSQYESLGNMSFAEKAVVTHFVILVLCWFTLEPGFVPGWGSFFKKGYISNAVPAMFVGCLLFVFPSTTAKPNTDDKRRQTLLDWKTFNRKYHWRVALLLGGGFALAHACKESGLSMWLAQRMAVMTGIPTWTMIVVVCLMISLCTEITTNTAVCTIFMPILADLANGILVNPIYLMLPAAISSSFAFMLPVATPPNTIAFSYGYLRIIDMVKVGWILNLLCVIVVTTAINTWGMTYFRLDVYPDWAVMPDQVASPVSNSTLINMINETPIMTSTQYVIQNVTSLFAK